jgi:uncharacterized membrane protein HdeD (DUF308 family)
MTTAVATQPKGRPWWLTLISGVLAVIIGAVLLWGGLLNKIDTYMLLVTFLGIWWMVQGIFDIIGIFIDHAMWGWKLFIGIVSIAAGFYILSYPIISAVALPKIFVLVLGIWGLMYGIILLIMAFQGGGWGAGILGVLGIIFGIALMANYTAPGMGLSMLWTAAVFAFVGGFFMIFRLWHLLLPEKAARRSYVGSD